MSGGIDGVIFDLDGTLWDARENICTSWNAVLAERYPQLGQLTPEQFNKQMGKLLTDIGQSLFPSLDREHSDKVTDDCCEYENEYLTEHGGVLYEGLEETLAALSEKYTLCLVSNCQSGYIEAFFAATGLGKYFTATECNGDTGLSKAENIALTVERCGLKRPVYVGDTLLDAQSAKLAGVPFVWAAYGFGEVSEYAARADRPGDLPGIVAAL